MDILWFQLINGLAGHNQLVDHFMVLCADYLPVVFALVLVTLWLSRRPRQQQGAFLAGSSALIALGIAQIINGIVMRARPYTFYETHLLVNRTTDPAIMPRLHLPLRQ